MKEKIKIRFRTPKDSARFVLYCSSYEEDIDVIQGRFIIDGKSILGVSSLGFNELFVEIHTDNSYISEKFYKEVKEKWGA
jgi:hypothetical protein